ncbi:Cytochrome P450 [Lentzea waywayandensis]|uniref:Cytochrome P450 n=1 Tax=Lentzea waywayandensis TaxID=84724 RepID=A0A1I6F201_9PSEU|nr:cytochrome P450 [Lentzea waywayandensis]SFR24015.1 Cytochrome P450 [Lentzea waywayandensis]
MLPLELDEEFPFSGSSYRGPDPKYDKLRAECPVAKVPTNSGTPTWVITKYEDVRAGLADSRLSRALTCVEGAPQVGGAMTTTPEMIISLDGSEHSRLRKLVMGAFTVRKVEAMRAGVQKVADELLDAIELKGAPVNLVEALCVPLPLTIIGDLLGVPTEDLKIFETDARAFATFDENDPEAPMRAFGRLAGYVMGLIAQKREKPGQDMLSDLISARDNGDKLSEQELVTFAFTLIGAGFDTAANQISNSVLALLHDHPDTWQRLVADPSLIPAAVEELLRHVNLFATDTTGFHRIAAEDLELGGQKIAKGDAVFFVLSSANRDEDVFENPRQLDIDRASNPHIAFGHGVHYCLGKQLGRMEMAIAIEGLTRRFPDLRLAVPYEDLLWHQGEINHSLVSLPVTWG